MCRLFSRDRRRGGLALLKRDGSFTLGVLTARDWSVGGGVLIDGRTSVTGSAIAGVAETQEMIDFCVDHGIVSDAAASGCQRGS